MTTTENATEAARERTLEDLSVEAVFLAQDISTRMATFNTGVQNAVSPDKEEPKLSSPPLGPLDSVSVKLRKTLKHLHDIESTLIRIIQVTTSEEY